MKTIKLRFRAKLPNGKWFNQNNQHLPSFLRRVLLLSGCEHPKYLKDKQLEDLLQIKIKGKWIQARF